MNIIGVKMSKPQTVELVVVVFWAAFAGLVGSELLIPLIGGNWKNIAGFIVSAALSGLAATCGASFDKAGLRGIMICVVAGVIGYGLIVSI